MSDKTKHLNLEYLSSDSESLTPRMEENRFVTLDTQLLSIFKALGNGRVSDASTWNLLTLEDLKNRAAVEGATLFFDNSKYFLEDPTGNKNDRFLYLTPGEGIVNNLGVQTLKNIKIGFLPYVINYIYLYTIDSTPLTKVPGITITSVEQDQSNTTQLLVGVVTVNDDGSSVSYSIDQSRLLEVSTLSLALKDLIQHTHGRDGISKIDLATEVRGLLSAQNISDIDPSRITEGTLNPAIISLSHILLQDIGDLTHEELDSAVELLQQDNKKLFGDLSTANLLQSVIAVKQSYANVDKYFRNLITIIPGLDNITDLNADSFLDHTSYVFSDIEATDAATKAAAIADISQDKRTDSAIADFANNEFRGILASGSSVGECTLDTKSEFDQGNFDENYVEVKSDETYVYGFGYTLDGTNFFDVFGVATGTFINGVPIHYGYALNPGLIEGFGWGYQLTAGGDFLPGNVSVTLIAGKTDINLYEPSNADISGDFIQDDAFYQEFFGAPQTTPTFSSDEFYITGLIKTSGGAGDAINIEYFNPILRYEVDTTKSSGFVGDLTDYNTLQITFGRLPGSDDYWYRTADLTVSPVEITEYTSYDFAGDSISPDATIDEYWLLRVTYTDDSILDITIQEMLPGLTINSDSIISIPLSTAKDGIYADKIVKRFEIIPKVKGTELNQFFTTNLLTPFNDSGLTSTPSSNIYFPAATIEDHEGIDNYYYYDDDLAINKIGSYPLPWARGIDAIGLTGNVKYSETDANNTITELYCIIASNPAVDWQTISWIGEEESDSKIIFELRSVDSNSVVGSAFDALADVDFGNPYSNKSGTVEGQAFTARPSGSQITEGADDTGTPRGTHMEIKIILQPSTDGLVAPILHSVTIRYSTSTDDAEISISGSEGFNPNLQTDSDRINIKLTSDSNEYLEIRHYDDLDKLFVGKDGSFSKHTRQSDGSFLIASTRDLISVTAPPSPHQIINGNNSRNEGVGKLYAIKKLVNHDLIVADTENHRILILDGNRNYAFKMGIYGSVGISSINRTTKTDGIDKDFSILQAIYNKTEKCIYVVFSHMLDDASFDVSSIQVTAANNLFDNYTLAGSSSYSTTLTYDFNKFLSGESKSHIRIPSGFYIRDQDGPQAGLIAGNVIRIKLSDTDANAINQIYSPRQINVLVYNQSSETYLVPVHQGLNPVVDGSDGGLKVKHRLFATLTESNIYYRAIVNPIDVEVLHDGSIAICNMIGNTGLEQNSTEFGDFDSFYRTSGISTINDVTSSSTTHPRIQLFDLSSSDLVKTNSNGDAVISQGNIDGDDNVVHFSLPYSGSFKEVLVGSTYRYLIADPGNKKIVLVDTDFTNKIWEAKIDDLTPSPGNSINYFPTCADKDSNYYYVTLIGNGSGIAYDNKVLKIAQDLSYEKLLDKQLSNPIDISVSGTNRIIIST